MKQFDIINEVTRDAIEIFARAEVHEQATGRVPITPGMRWWELDLITLKIREAVLTSPRVELVDERDLFYGLTGRKIPQTVYDLKIAPHLRFRPASNARNAKRKFLNSIKNEALKKRLKEAQESNSSQETAPSQS